MAISLQLVQKQTQRLIMTPQMQQSIQLLQLNSLELEQMVEQEMLENPFLELVDEQDDEDRPTEPSELEAIAAEVGLDGNTPIDTDQAEAPEDNSPEAESKREEQAADPLDLPEVTAVDLAEEPAQFDDVDVNWDELFDDAESPVYTPPASDEEERDFTEFTAARTSLFDYLSWQLRLSALSEDDQKIGEFLVGCVDEDGYISEPLERVAEELGVDLQRVEHVLSVLQEFDPPGVFARNLAECLLLQLQDHGRRTEIAEKVLGEHFELLKKRRFREIARAMEVDEEKIVSLFNEIRRLEPKPGRIRSKDQIRYISPDVSVREIDGEYIYSLNEGGSSRLRISKVYKDILRNQRNSLDPKEKEYAQERLRSAVMLLKNIEKRKSTVLRVTECIMEHQKGFIEKGIAALKPLTLREIADKVGMHEATISRVTSGKYVETPQGLFELKFFFSSGIESDSGEAASSRSIKDLIDDMISREDPKKPLSDEKLARMIHEKGFQIARRTVAKYREQMKILPAKLRRQSN